MSLGSSGVVRSRRVHSGYDWQSLGSSGAVEFTGGDIGVVDLVVRFTGVGPGSSLVHPWSMGSIVWVSLGSSRVVNGHALGFIWGRWVHSGSPWVSLTPVVLWGRSGSLGSLGFLESLCAFGFVRGGWVHSSVCRRSLGSSGVIEFTRVRPWVR